MSDKQKVRIPLTRYEWPDERLERIKKRRRVYTLVLALVLSFGLGFTVKTALTPVSPVVSVSEGTEFDRLKAVYQVLINDWYFGKDLNDLDQQLINSAILGMVEATGDPHTAYMTADEVKAFTEAIDRGFVGIGVSYFDSNGSYIVDRVFMDSPAAKAGVQPGDIIYKVDGVDVTGIGSDVLVDMVRGEEDTVVGIDFIRGNETVHLDITRGPINNTAYGEMVDKDTAYLEISQFGSSTAEEVKTYLETFKTAQAQNIIIDVRNDGGGYLTALEDIGSLLVPKDEILIQQDTRDGERIVSKSKGNVVLSFDKIVVLVNENTASAAEVLTAALKEDMSATVVGVKTYGKGTVQQQQPFSDGASLKYTVAQWLTPSGETIHKIGITPDVVVEQHPIMTRGFTQLKDDEAYTLDQVHTSIQDVQIALDFLGYTVDRQDGYYSQKTFEALTQYQSEKGLTQDGLVTKSLLESLASEVVRVWHQERDTKDLQRIEALKIVNE